MITATMNAVVLTGHGGLDKLEILSDYPTPTAGPGEVLIEVRACGLNNTDIWVREGAYGTDENPDEVASWRRGQPNSLIFPRIQGGDIAGYIVEVGSGVSRSRQGERVMVDFSLYNTETESMAYIDYIGHGRDGGYADYCVVPAENAYVVDNDLHETELATFCCAYLTAEHMLDRVRVKKGETVVVTGASGGVGSGLIQLCRARGAIPVAISSSGYEERLTSVGAEAVLIRNSNSLSLQFESALEVDDSERQVEYEGFWQRGGVVFLGAYTDLAKSLEANETAAEFIRQKIRQTVNDPVVAETLVPTYTIGCKRLAVDTNYYETYNRSNVTLVDVSQSPIQKITPKGVYALDQEYNLDSLIMATGFDAMTGTLLKIDIRGRDGLTLKEKWAEGPKGYLGLGISGFPNLFMITGPGSPSVLTNMMQSIEQHVDWIVACLEHLRTHNISAIEATQSAEDDWVAHNDAVADDHMRNSCSSWYVGGNIEGKPRVFMPYVGGFPLYVQKCNEVATQNYLGFALTP